MPRYFDFEVSLMYIEPRIWRRFLLAESATFEDLHDAIQDSLGWEREHLFEFRDKAGKTTIAACDYDDPYAEIEVPVASEAKLSGYFRGHGKTCRYVYDFGDNWEHSVLFKGFVEDSAEFRRRLVDGARACPLEDCGGAWGYEDCCHVAAMSDEDIDGLGEDAGEAVWRKEWVGDWDPEAFDLAAARKAFR